MNRYPYAPGTLCFELSGGKILSHRAMHKEDGSPKYPEKIFAFEVVRIYYTNY